MKTRKKHSWTTRLWHWINLLCVVILFMSGLNISNAHPRLYWGDWGFAAEDAWLEVIRFPGWSTIPGHYSLAAARDWHFLAAWPFALILLFMWVAMLVNSHFWRDLRTRMVEWKPSAIKKDVVEHAKLNFEHRTPGAEGKYNFLQKLSYGLVLGVFLPLMVLTGIGISPGMEPAFGWMVDLMGGRQSVRSIHFIVSFALFAFMIVHVLLVLLAGPIGQLRDMITGGTLDDEPAKGDAK